MDTQTMWQIFTVYLSKTAWTFKLMCGKHVYFEQLFLITWFQSRVEFCCIRLNHTYMCICLSHMLLYTGMHQDLMSCFRPYRHFPESGFLVSGMLLALPVTVSTAPLVYRVLCPTAPFCLISAAVQGTQYAASTDRVTVQTSPASSSKDILQKKE